MTSTYAVLSEGLEKRFGDVQALKGLDLRVPQGSVCGLLGQNGAGKTTAVRILTTLLAPDAGTARVAGLDVVREPAGVRSRIAVVGQQTSVDTELTGAENLRLFARLRRVPGARERADELLERFGLAKAADRVVGTYSGGMRRRLDLAASLVVQPQVLFLDEPTTGLDPRGRAWMWDAVRELAREGTGVLLTTQYLEEADQLADEVVLMGDGKVAHRGTPAELKSRLGRLAEVTVTEPGALAAAAVVLDQLTGRLPILDEEHRTARATVLDPDVSLPQLVRELDAAGVPLADVGLRLPTLDEVFMRLTAGEEARR